MIQNELLPGCAVLLDDEVHIWNVLDFQSTTTEKAKALYEIQPIPLTAESVAKVGGCKRFYIIDNVDSFKFQAGFFNVVVHFFNDGHCEVFINGIEIHHCKAIHSLQITLERLQGTMPSYQTEYYNPLDDADDPRTMGLSNG